MAGLGTIVNVILILTGGAAGLILKKFLSKRFTEIIIQGLGLAVIIIGLGGAFSNIFKISDDGISMQYTLVMIISLGLGALTGELIGIEAKLEKFAAAFEKKFKDADKTSTFTQGFVTATLMFCVGAMSIVGALEDGINRDTGILFSKSALDCISSAIFASTLGIGVLFSAVAVGLYQGLITLLAVFIAPYLGAEIIAQMSAIGSVLIMAIGFNMLKITNIKTGNLLPSMFIPVFYYLIKSFFK